MEIAKPPLDTALDSLLEQGLEWVTSRSASNSNHPGNAAPTNRTMSPRSILHETGVVVLHHSSSMLWYPHSQP